MAAMAVSYRRPVFAGGAVPGRIGDSGYDIHNRYRLFLPLVN
jgi:hypothetical protein